MSTFRDEAILRWLAPGYEDYTIDEIKLGLESAAQQTEIERLRGILETIRDGSQELRKKWLDNEYDLDTFGHIRRTAELAAEALENND